MLTGITWVTEGMRVRPKAGGTRGTVQDWYFIAPPPDHFDFGIPNTDLCMVVLEDKRVFEDCELKRA